MKTPERNKLQRELKILQAKKRSGLNFSASDAERLSDLEAQVDDNDDRDLAIEDKSLHTEPLMIDDSSILELSDEDLPEAELVDPNTLFDSLSDVEAESPTLSLDEPLPPSQGSSANDLDNDAYSPGLPDPACAEKEGQELLQTLFDDTATGYLDENGTLTKATPLSKTTANANKSADAKPPARVALGKLRITGQPLTAKTSAGSARSETEPPLVNQYKGPRKAIVHFLDGVCQRGSISQLDILSDFIQLNAQSNETTSAKELSTDKIKTIFLLLPRGATYPQKVGTPIKVLLIDGRSLAGTSPDYDANCRAFTLLPAEDKGNIERVIIFRRGAKQIEVAD